jgi:hypothetical protein
MQLRLIDPNGYEAVTEGHRVEGVPADCIADEAARLKSEVARRHAEEHPYARYHVSEYSVRVHPEGHQC